MWWNFPETGIPDCVPEMFREQFERDAREAELEHNRNEHYKANRKKREEAREQGYPILDFGGYDACRTAPMLIMIHRLVSMMISTL